MRLFFNILSCFLILGSLNSYASQSITAENAKKLIKEKSAILLDVREASEIKASGKAKGALWLPTSKINRKPKSLQQFFSKLDPKAPVVLYCKSGGRAGRIAKLLEQQGSSTYNMGGFSDWKKAGFAITP